MSTNQKWVYQFGEVGEVEKAVGSWDGVRGLLGGKGANLADMVRIGVTVPPGFIVTTAACNAYLAAGAQFPEGMWEQILVAVRSLEAQSGKLLGDPARPLLVSCRSGAKFSMPGMMDTVLNIGLNDAVAAGLCTLTGDRRFVYDAYRRLVQMFGTVVLGLKSAPFEAALDRYRELRGVSNDADLQPDDLVMLTAEFKGLVRSLSGRDMPDDPLEQLRLSTEAVFRSWNGKRAIDYRKAAGIPHDLGTAVNIVTMIFGNLGQGSGTGVATTRNVSTGEHELEGDYLQNAQGEDVVAGIRQTERIADLAAHAPALFAEFSRICEKLERHYKDVQDIEFTIERGKLWILQTRAAKRTPRAALRIAVELCEEGLISREEAVQRCSPAHVEYFLHPQCDEAAKAQAQARGERLGTGLNVSPGAAVGQLCFDADTAERWAKAEKRAVILARPETKPEDVHGILAGSGVITSHGGRTSHAALVARQFGKPAIVGASALRIDPQARTLTAGTCVLREGDWVSIDGSTGEIFAGQLKTASPKVSDPYLLKLLDWADAIRRLQVWANADYPRDAQRAREYGAQGIGLCRTEHMFFETDRLPHMQAMILAATEEERAAALKRLLPFQRSDFEGLFRAMDGLPVTIRLIDPPLHEFLPDYDALLREVTETETRFACLEHETAEDRENLARKRRVLASVGAMREENPMLGLRGVRLGIHLPGLVRMQVRALFEAACACVRDGITVKPKIMIPLVALNSELRIERLKSPRAFSQQPPSRSHHLLQQPSVETLDAAANHFVTRTEFHYSEARGDEMLMLVGTAFHHFRVDGDGALRFTLKRVNLLNCDAALPSIQLFI